MQETKNSSWYSTVAGALFALGGVMELFQWLSIFRFMSFGGHVQKLLWVASYAVLAFALLTKRRDIFLPVGFALAGIACLFPWISEVFSCCWVTGAWRSWPWSL